MSGQGSNNLNVPDTVPYYVDQHLFSVGRFALTVSLGAFGALVVLIAFQIIGPLVLHRPSVTIIELPYGLAEKNLFAYILASYGVHLLLFLIIVLSGIVGYRLVSASGANPAMVIPPQDKELLVPLITAGNSDGIDQYVRLSSLSGFTGTFTQLGLTGLPLATIFMTLFFTCLTMYDAKTFLDLTKLTLGAFLGSFVQRQVEQRRAAVAPQSAKKTDQASSPYTSA